MNTPSDNFIQSRYLRKEQVFEASKNFWLHLPESINFYNKNILKILPQTLENYRFWFDYMVILYVIQKS